MGILALPWTRYAVGYCNGFLGGGPSVALIRVWLVSESSTSWSNAGE